MSRIIVYFNNLPCDFVNIVGDRIEQSQDGTMVVAFSGDRVVGMFDVSVIMAIYISEKGGGYDARLHEM